NLVDDYFKIIAEELRTGINQKTGKPLTDLEKAQRWSAVASAIAVVAVGAHYGAKGFTGKGAKLSKNPVLKGSKDGKNYTLDRDKSKGSSGYKKASGANLNKLKPNEINNMSLDELRNSIPKDWQFFENNGRVHIKDASGQMRVRIDPPDKITKYQHMHIYDDLGNPLDKIGNIVDRTSPEGHLPWNDK
ncbi:hypothetical protein ACWOC1_07090, partial [Enterococcus quebecensis]